MAFGILSFLSSPLGLLFAWGALAISWLGWYPLKRWRYRAFPGPIGLPFLGNIPHIVAMDTTKYLEYVAKKYGKISKIWFGSTPWVLIADAELMRKYCYKLLNRFPVEDFLHVAVDDVRDQDQAGVVVARGAEWRQTRYVFEAAAIHPAKLAVQVPVLDRCLGQLAVRLRRLAAAGQPSDLWALMQDLTLAETGRIAYGVNFGTLDDCTPEGAAGGATSPASAAPAPTAAPTASGGALKTAVQQVFRTMEMDNASAYLPLQLMFPEFKPVIRWLASRLPDPKQSVFMASRRRVAEESRRIMDAWQQQQQQGGAGGSSVGCSGAAGDVSSTSFMAAMLEGRKGASREDRLTDTQIIAQGFTFIVAGAETTANTIGFAIVLLALHPEAEARLVEEARSVSGRELSEELLGQLPYTDAVVKEVLRMYPSVTFLVREAAEDIDLGEGRVVPSGSCVTFLSHVLHYDPAVWVQPERFLPQRWLPETRGSLGPNDPNAYAPFGLGARMCVGHKLATLSAKAALVRLYDKFTFAVDPRVSLPLRTKTGLTLSPADAIMVTVRER